MPKPRTIYVDPFMVAVVQDTVLNPTGWHSFPVVEILLTSGGRVVVHNTPVEEVKSALEAAVNNSEGFATIIERTP